MNAEEPILLENQQVILTEGSCPIQGEHRYCTMSLTFSCQFSSSPQHLGRIGSVA